MSYLSLSFPLFVAISMVFYYLLPNKYRYGVLLVASIIFYGLFDLRFLLFLLFCALSTFACARRIANSKNQKFLITICIALNALLWFSVKGIPTILTSFDIPLSNFIVPVGISYFTLQAVAYLVDVSKGRTNPESNFFKYLLFLAWFPAIVQGPISRYSQLMPQLTNTQKFSFENTRKAFLLIAFGLVKKMVIADRLGIFADHCFTNVQELKGIILYLGAVAYAFQIYMDFSGCVNICRGVSNLFSIDLVENFNRPYFASSIKEFWGKWHISFSSWLKDYIYIPLGGNRKGKKRKFLNIIITFMVSGIWHGVGLSFIIWGLLHALYQIIGESTVSYRNNIKKKMGIKKDSHFERYIKIFITFNLVTFAWIFFRASDVPTAFQYIGNMFSTHGIWALFDGSMFIKGFWQNAILHVVFHIIFIAFMEKRFPKVENSVEYVVSLPFVVRWFVYLLIVFDIVLFGVYGTGYDASSFMYGGF